MSDFFAFRFYEPNDDKRKSLVLFFTTNVSLGLVANALKEDVAENLVPKNVYLIAPENVSKKQIEYSEDDFFVEQFDSYVGDMNQHLIHLGFNGVGSLQYSNGEKIQQNLSNAILQSGMIELFKKHSGLIVSSHGYHFTKPSGSHCNKFIRASNLLVSSIEVSFLAISLLPYLRKDIKRIYVDTSSIAYLVSTAVQLFGEFNSGPPLIESFESYAVLNEPYDFVEDNTSILLISATTSGSLAKNLLSKTTFSRSQVITIFHINLPEKQIGIFDVTSAIPGNITSQKESDCDFCKHGAKLIRIAGDQFLPENPKHELLVIKKADLSKQRQLFFEQFSARNVLNWNISASSGYDSKEHFFIAVNNSLDIETKIFKKDLEKNIKRYVSRDLGVVIAFDDTGSRALEDKIREYLGDDATNSIVWCTPSSLKEEDTKDAASVLVLASAITSGRSLLSISRKLRGIDPSATITYFIAFSKLPNKDSFEQLRKDLCQGGHELVVLNHCSVPRIKEHTRTAWDCEREALQPYSNDDPLGEENSALPELLAKRLNSISSENSDSNSLFLPDPCGQALKLRRTFAFWSDFDFNGDRLNQTSQSDVYWTIQCVLHDLRNASEDNGLSTTYHTTLISPANFDRYNDGVIQACLIRSALPVELDYRVDPIFSRQMTDIILSILANWNNAQGEALLEFLLALWTKRLRINNAHINEILNFNRDGLPEVVNFLLGCIHKSVQS